MNDDRHQRLYEIFQRACDVPPEELEPYLDEACADDPAMRAQVEKLLAQHATDSSLLEEPLAIELAAEMRDHTGARDVPERIDKYRILRELGQGGMGVVYLAQQESPHRAVAIKLLAASVVTPRLLARFELEADVLARLQHPGIAQIYDSGTAQISGVSHPYFAMEYVEGLSLLEYAESHRLNDAARLGLVMKLCEAVHHAHQKGVIHRDLKPANILVTANGQLKVLDFGIARLTDADIKTTTLRTHVGEVIGTIPYMSPEQAVGDSEQLDIRSDVYALGVVAYQLLSGHLPYDLQERMIHEAIRVVREQSPTPLSSIIPRLRGDVETIVGKALEKEPERRYQSALALEDDIRRFLEDQPITARPPSVVYQLRKFAQRNALLVASAACILVLLISAILVTSTLAVRNKRQRDRAVQLQEQALAAQRAAELAKDSAEQAVKAQVAISGFLQDVFAAGSPFVGRKEMTVADALEVAAQRVDEKLIDQPAAAVAVRMRLSDTYFSLGKLQSSIDQLEAALALAQSLDPPDLADLVAIRAGLGQLYLQAGKLPLAKQHLTAAMKWIDEPAVRDQPARALTLVNYAAVLIGESKFDEAIPMLEEGLRLREAEFGTDHPYTMTVRNNLAIATRRVGRLDEARILTRQNMESHRQTLGDKHPNTITGIYNYADLLRELEEFDESEALFELTLSLGTANLPTRHFLLGQYRSGYGELLRVQQKYDTAEPELKLGYEILDEQLGAKHPQTVRARERLVRLYEEAERPGDADKFRETE